MHSRPIPITVVSMKPKWQNIELVLLIHPNSINAIHKGNAIANDANEVMLWLPIDIFVQVYEKKINY